jgi:hypothetical protein
MRSMTRLRDPGYLFLICAAAITACGPPAPGVTCIAPAEDASATCVRRDRVLHNDMPRNGLSREALMDPGMANILAVMRTHALNDPGDTALGLALQSDATYGPDAMSLVEYIISCALDRETTVAFQLGDGTGVQWSGEVGLCGAHSPPPFGNWGAVPPSKDCLEIVSSCVLARVNALHKKVIISARGDSQCVLPLQPEVAVEAEYRECDGTPIRSLQTCSGPWTDPGARDCGWTGRLVGSCERDTEVTLVTNPQAAGTAVRVCKGLYGCDHEDSPAPPGAPACGSAAGYPEGTPWYAGVIPPIQTDPVHHTVTFRCPHDGLTTGRAYFSVMLAASAPGVPLANGADVEVKGGTATYPASETDVFTFREGAFFGNIFDDLKARPNKADGEQVLFNDQYACYSDTWSAGAAQLTDRLCAGPGNDPPCFENPPEPCLWSTGSPGTLAPGNHCDAQSCDDDQSYLGCQWNAPWKHAITVFLNHPCDLARDLVTCGKIYPGFSQNDL